MNEELALETAQTGIAVDDLPRLSRQELEFVASYVAGGNNAKAASERAGLNYKSALALLKKPEIQEHIDYQLARYTQTLSDEVSYTLKDAHIDIEMGKRMASNAGEWFKGVELHMKLHGLTDKDKGVTININQIDSREKMEQLDDEELLRLSGFSFEDLLPQAVEGEIVDGSNGCISDGE